MIKIQEHPLARALRAANIPLHRLTIELGGTPCPSELSRMLRGLRPMPDDLPERIRAILDEVEAEQKGKNT
jgi:hypothetical protein